MISKMNKEEFVSLKESQGIKKEEILAKWQDFEEQFKQIGVKDPELSERIKRRLQSWFVLQAQTMGDDFKAVFIGMKESDYGARKQFYTATEAYKKDAQQAIASGLVNAEGKPIVQKGFRAGQLININEITRTFIGMLQVEAGFISCELRTTAKLLPDFFALQAFNAIKNKTKSTPSHVILNATEKTSFTPEKQMDDTESIGFLQKYYGNKLVEMRNLREFIKNNEGKFDEFCIIRGDVFRIVDDERTKQDLMGNTVAKQNVLGLNSTNDETPIEINCLAPPDVKFNIIQGAENVIVIGRPYVMQNDDKLAMRLYGYYAPRAYRKKAVASFKTPAMIVDDSPVVGEGW